MGSRLKNSFKNSFWGATSNLVCTLLNFFVRTIFIKTLGSDYLGINGLFTNILFILSFAELGVGQAITYCMYKPAADNDKEKIKSLLKLYKQFYTIIGFVIFGLGVIIIPFIPIIIKDMPNIKENLILIYLLYLFETAASYFFSYKRSIIIVNQKDYLCDVVKLILSITKSAIQTIILFTTKNYILYLIIYILSTLLTNVILSLIADKKYPYIMERDAKELDRKEKNAIITNIKSLILYKLGRVSLSGTDNIIISYLIGITTVGMYSNYSLIISAISGFTYTILSGVISSVGNINATESISKKEKIMGELLFISSWMYGFICICLAILLNPFVTIWIGEKYLLDINVILASVFYILIDGLEFSSHIYVSTMGLFKHTRYSSLICALLNIILSLLLGKLWGLFGIFAASSLSKMLTTSWFDTYVVYKNSLNKSPKNYYLRHFSLLICIVINYLICSYVVRLISGANVLSFVLKAIITVILSNVLFIIFFHNTEEFKYLLNKLTGGKKHV